VAAIAVPKELSELQEVLRIKEVGGKDPMEPYSREEAIAAKGVASKEPELL
jgi:hypothetical protein